MHAHFRGNLLSDHAYDRDAAHYGRRQNKAYAEAGIPENGGDVSSFMERQRQKYEKEQM